MNRLEMKLSVLKKSGRKALVAFITAGYPSIKETKELVRAMEQAGADIIELGVPFSDPIADGPTIQYSSEQALRKGVTLEQILTLVKELRKKTSIPILLMGYLNPFMRHGIERTMQMAAKAGVDGLIIPDMIPEECGSISKAVSNNGLSMIHLVAPNTPPERMAMIDRAARGFVYVVSITGVTGKRATMPSRLKSYLATTGAHMKHMRFMGFGISGPAQVTAYKKYIDGVIIGSALVNIIKEHHARAPRLSSVRLFISGIRTALDA